MRTTVIGLLVVAAVLGPASAAAADPRPAGRFTVVESAPVGGGYVETEGMLSASFVRQDGSAGSYEAPVQLLHPKRRALCSGVGVEDLANAAFFNFPLLRDEEWSFRFARLMLGDAFLMARGVVYAAPVWDKKAVDRMGMGTIERPEDGRRIVDDVSRFLRDPGSVEIVGPGAALIERACPAETLVGYGFSDSASLLRTYFAEGNGARVFDAALIHTAGSMCWDFAVGQAVAGCGELPQRLNAKVISLDAETDVQIQGGAGARQQLPEYRHYEIAGAAHLPKREFDLIEMARRADDENPVFATALRTASRFQNPEAMGPVTRAAFHHLVRWARRGVTPPGNAHLEGSFDALGQFQIARDRDGNARGGIRLPWLETALDGGSRGGAALGTHDGVDPAGGFVLGGRYECFADIRARHPSQRVYRKRVAAGARFAKSMGWILERDRRSYVRRAARLDLDRVPCPPWGSGSDSSGVELPARPR